MSIQLSEYTSYIKNIVVLNFLLHVWRNIRDDAMGLLSGRCGAMHGMRYVQASRDNLHNPRLDSHGITQAKLKILEPLRARLLRACPAARNCSTCN